jgi:uncharacterized membrane protein YukC
MTNVIIFMVTSTVFYFVLKKMLEKAIYTSYDGFLEDVYNSSLKGLQKVKSSTQNLLKLYGKFGWAPKASSTGAN